MRSFIVIRDVNRVLMSINIILYLTIYLGMIFQILLGISHLLIAVGLFYFWNYFDRKDKINLITYWIVVLSYGLTWYLDWFNNMRHNIFYFFIIPMLIAVIFTLFLEKSKLNIEINSQ